MDFLSSEARNRIMKQGLKELQEREYLSWEIYAQVLDAQETYFRSLQEKSDIADQSTAENPTEKPIIKTAKPKPEKVKKVRSPQEIRERNITWSLNLGVILLLIGGLYLATSTWEMLDDWMKTGLVALVSALFFGLASFTRNLLKIEKTAFAFYVLGGLFLPIVILSAGYFELFGNYFSIVGEGRYLLGASGSLLILPVYLLLAEKLASRLFIWFSYLTFTVFAGFVVAAMYLPIDGFYLGIMVFNAILIIGYRLYRNKGRFAWITKEFVSYIQVNLVISTLLMLFFYDSELLYSFNLILTAVIYLSMIYVTNRKEYHFVFSAMLVYGAYQLIEHSLLNEFGSIGYALLGIVFVILPNQLSKQIPLQRVFRYTSAIVSGCAFLYISWEGLVLRMNEPSFVLLVAYLIIALNFTYLSTIETNRLFMYLSPVFMVSACYELVLLGQEWFNYNTIELPMFIAAFVLYCGIGCYIQHPFLKTIRESTRDVSAIVMLVCALIGFGLMNWWQTGVMLILFSVIALLALHFEKRKTLQESAPWIHALSLGFAIVFLAEEAINFYKADQPFESINLIGASVLLLLARYAWKRASLVSSAFFVSQALYALGLVGAFSLDVGNFVRSSIVFGGVGMALLLYRKTKWTVVPYVVSSHTLLTYLTLLYAVHNEWTIESNLVLSLQYTAGALILLLIGLLIGKRESRLMNGFVWVGHCFLPFTLLGSYMIDYTDAVWTLILGTLGYAVSVYQAKVEWKLKAFLYAGFTTVTMFVQLVMIKTGWQEYDHYSFLISSVMMTITWVLSKSEWSRRIAYYLVPFSVIGISVFMAETRYEWPTFVVTVLYAAGVLFIMHREKWELYSIVPLALVYFVIRSYGQMNPFWENFSLLAYTSFTVVATIVGLLLYKRVYEKRWGGIDWYSIVGFLTTLSMYAYTGEALWTKLLPGMLISATVFLQRKRIPNVPSKWLVFGGCGYLLQPYYEVLMNVSVPELFERELYVLPWVVLAIVLKKVADPKHKVVINRIQWAVLVIVSLLLVQDGMASNTVYDAIIVGTLSLASMLAGMAYRIKSFFFVGAGVLLLNVFLQTRPYWGNLPWWGYLLIAGSILVAVASYNEWHKQKTSEGKVTLITKFNKTIVQKIKKWD